MRLPELFVLFLLNEKVRKVLAISLLTFLLSLSKSKEGAPADIYEQIAQAIVGYEDFVPSDNTIDYDQYMGMLD